MTEQREHREQKALFAWRDWNVNKYPHIDLMHSTLNGAHLNGSPRRRAAQWAKLKSAGAKTGVHDILLPVPRGGFHGLWIEFKASHPHSAPITEQQTEWLISMRLMGYRAEVAKGVDAAIDVIKSYYDLPCGLPSSHTAG